MIPKLREYLSPEELLSFRYWAHFEGYGDILEKDDMFQRATYLNYCRATQCNCCASL